jgi:hypothetical protein
VLILTAKLSFSRFSRSIAQTLEEDNSLDQKSIIPLFCISRRLTAEADSE